MLHRRQFLGFACDGTAAAKPDRHAGARITAQSARDGKSRSSLCRAPDVATSLSCIVRERMGATGICRIVAGECRYDLQQAQQRSIFRHRLRGSWTEQYAPGHRARSGRSGESSIDLRSNGRVDRSLRGLPRSQPVFLEIRCLHGRKRRAYRGRTPWLRSLQRPSEMHKLSCGRRKAPVYRQHDGESRRAAQSGSCLLQRDAAG